jgi:hypothetical protein
VATETDAARDRVLAARTEFETELERLEAAGRAAVDIPARIKRSPGKAAAVVGGIGFLALKGPQRVVRGARRIVRGGKPEPLPKQMLPEEIEKTLRKLGDDGDKVRGTLERDFANYAKQSARDRRGVTVALVLAFARPILGRAARALAEFLFTPDSRDFAQRLQDVRDRTTRMTTPEPQPGTDRIAEVRRDDAEADRAAAADATPVGAGR